MSTSSAFCNSQGNRRLQLLYNIAPPRYNTISPYPKYTQDELNMRRKAEILKYKSNNQNSKSNGFTKAKNWSNIVTTNKNALSVITCEQDRDMIPTPTYFSDIPGPVQYLVNNTKIPLYNFNLNTSAYGITPNNNNNELWQLITEDNIYFSNGIQTPLFRILILDKIDKSTYSFQYQTPIAFYLTGDNQGIVSSTAPPYDCSLNITDINVAVTYGGNVVNLATSAICDIKNVAYKSGIPYRFYFYLGMLTINIADMRTTPGFIYDVNVSFNIDTFLLGNYYNINNVGIYANLQNADFLTSVNAVTTDASSNHFSTYGISGS